MRLVIFGVGYVGLVTGTGMAELGHDVLCVDISEEKIAKLLDNEIPIYEPGLSDLVRRNVRAGRLTFSTTVAEDYRTAEAYFIAVGTPPLKDGSADTSAVMAVGAQIAALACKEALVIVKSTVPVGTCAELQRTIGHGSLEVVSNPEFLKEGAALQDFFHPDRIVLGVRNPSTVETLRRLYAPLQLVGEKIIVTDPQSSELTKYAANTMLAMRISFMNELSRLCHKTGANVSDVRLGIGSDSRIGPRFLYAGAGYGGSCFPKDVRALIKLGEKHDTEMRLASAAHEANEDQVHFLTGLVFRALGPLEDPKLVALWGLAFKPETDDVRDAPSVKLTGALRQYGVGVTGHDPEAGSNFARAVASPIMCHNVIDDQYAVLNNADVLVLLTEWRNYLAPDFAEIKRRMRGRAVVDARNVWRRADVEAAGLTYQGIGT